MEYTKDQKRKIFDSLPEDLREAILSVETSEKLRGVYNKHGLMLDQAGELGDEVGLFMLGITKQDVFVKNVSARLGIPYEKATQISMDINKEIFDSIRASLQKIQDHEQTEEIQIPSPPQQPPKPLVTPPILPTNLPKSPNTLNLSSIEKAGNFTIEKRPPSNSPQYNDSNLKRDAVLNDLENIEKLKPINAPNFVDHLLSNPVSTPQKTEVRKAPVVKPATDPYREPAE